MRRLLFLLLFLAVPVWAGNDIIVLSGDASAATAKKKAPPTLAQQAATMSPGEWKQLVTVNEWPDVRVTEAELTAIETATGSHDIGGWGGSARVFQAWNGGAWDEAENRWFFWGGGHNGYGGNEVYSFDMDTLTWTRVSEPAPLTFFSDDAEYPKWLPEDADSNGKPDSPGVPHTYDMLTFGNGKIIALQQASVYAGPGGAGKQNQFYTFDPDKAEWTPHASHDYKTAACEYIGSEGYSFCLDSLGSNYHELNLINDNGTETKCGHLRGIPENGRYGVIYRYPETGKMYDFRYYNLSEITIESDDCAPTITELKTLPIAGELGFDFEWGYNGVASIGDGNLYMWNGFNHIVKYNIATNTLEGLAFDDQADTGPFEPRDWGDNKVLSKWRCFKTEGVCLGIADGDTVNNPRGGFWMWKPGPDTGSNQAKPSSVR